MLRIGDSVAEYFIVENGANSAVKDKDFYYVRM
jgi:hypothetical protein